MIGKRFFCMSCNEPVTVFDEENGRWCPVCATELYKLDHEIDIGKMPYPEVKLHIYNVPFCKN